MIALNYHGAVDLKRLRAFPDEIISSSNPAPAAWLVDQYENAEFHEVARR
jgi:hypothetical protein